MGASPAEQVGALKGEDRSRFCEVRFTFFRRGKGFSVCRQVGVFHYAAISRVQRGSVEDVHITRASGDRH